MTGKEYEMIFKLQAQLGGSYNKTFQSAQNAITSMQREIQALSRTQSDIAAFEKQQKAIESTKQKLAVLQQQYDNVQREIAETGEFSSTLENKLLSKQQQIDKTSSSLQQQTQKLGAMSSALHEAGISTDNLENESAQLGAQIDELKQKQEAAADEAQNFGNSGVAAVGAFHEALAAAGIAEAMHEIYEAMTECAEASIQFESVMTGVSKTTELSDKELAQMSKSIKGLSTDIPITTDALGAVSETAGQLGIAKENLLDFATTMSMLDTATTMTADDAATMLAQFANITQMDPSYYDELGSAIVDLGNTYATTEQRITEMSQGIAASASLADMSESDMLGLSAAVSSLGIETQMGSTAISKLISALMTAVETGEDLDEFARIANMTADEFTTAWGEDAAGALSKFVTGLSDTARLGSSAIVTLTDLGITETRMQRTILSLSNSGDLLTRAISSSNQAWDENIALQNEAEKRYATTASMQTLVENAYSNLEIAIGDAYTPTLRKLYAVEKDLLIGATEFIEKNPALVKGITTFLGLTLTATTALAAYTAAVKLATVFSGAFAMATGTALLPVIGLIAGVSGVVAGVVALSSAADEAVPPVDELTEAAQNMADTMEAAQGTYEDVIVSTIAAADAAKIYIDELEQMESAGLSAEERAGAYHNTLALLCETIPELADSINLETNTIDGGTAALRNNTAAWEANAKAQAYQDYLKTVYAEQAKVLIEAQKNSVGLTKAQYELESAQKTHNDTVARMNELYAKAQEEASAYSKKTGDLSDATSFLTEEYYDLQNSLTQSADDINIAQKSIENYTEAVEQDGEAVAEAEEQISLAEEAVNRLTGATDEGNRSTEEAARQARILDSAIADVSSQMKALTDAYQEAYDAALDSISGQYDLWDKADKVVATSAGSINSALESQIGYWQNYNTNLQSLTARSGEIEGLGDVIASFADGSQESVNAIAGMASASDADLAAMVANWQTLQAEQKNASGSVADLKTDFTQTMDELQQELAADIEAMDLGPEAAESGRATIQGFINGAEGMINQVQTAYARVAQAGIDAINAKLAIHSPSRVMMEKAEMTWAGYINQTNAMEPEVAAAMSDAVGAGLQAINAEDAQIITIAPQLMDYLSASNAASITTTPASAIVPTSSPVMIQYSPQYNLDGVSNPAEMEAVLRKHDEEFREYILEVIDDANADARRRAYI